ncbi:F0F1 ATP synthase subunit delta [Legionella fallonii]|uniref:ATP synthase subunit b n=1 Tax=Legionella fallonii LLAP-10 TaxID=1212491 RepID=A0A098G6Z6_9GAMM|nr:F0F1 ATP synthase subunit delta [Legionella fallonii]CEG57754.1 ATP synthase subunit b [Legionella fallonii LLAP-10]
MELSWSTLILEIINFLVLIWILNYFLYAPIQKTIIARKKMVADKLEHAETLRSESQDLQLKYENRLADWQVEKERLQKEFQLKLEQWKSAEVVDFEKKLATEKEALLVREMKKSKELIEKNAREAMLLAGKFSVKFLKNFADEHLEEKIIEKTILDLEDLPVEKIQFLTSQSSQDTILIQSAYPINEQQRHILVETIEKLSHKQFKVDFSVTPELLAGLMIQIGSVVLQANLRDELKFFTEIKNAIA